MQNVVFKIGDVVRTKGFMDTNYDYQPPIQGVISDISEDGNVAWIDCLEGTCVGFTKNLTLIKSNKE